MRWALITLAIVSASPALAGQTTTLVIANQHNKTYRGLNIATTSGDCVQITNSTGITIEQSQIGPCGGNAVAIQGSTEIKILDSYIHPETQSPGCCDNNDGIVAQTSSNITVQGNVIAYSESNVEAPQQVANLTVKGNFLLNPRGPFPRGQNVQAWNSKNVTVQNNYALSSQDTTQYLYSAHQEDSINFGLGTGFLATGNYITGGTSPSGCGLIADDGANSATFAHNRLVDTGQCGISIASGTNQTVVHNSVINRNPIPNAGNTAMVVWNQYGVTPCGPVTMENNIATEIRSDGTQSGFWTGGGCGALTLKANIWDQAAEIRLTPVATKLPPPLIPPQPAHCVAVSPYSNQTAWPACPAPE